MDTAKWLLRAIEKHATKKLGKRVKISKHDTKTLTESVNDFKKELKK